MRAAVIQYRVIYGDDSIKFKSVKAPERAWMRSDTSQAL